MVRAARRLFRIAIATQVGADDGEFLGETRREFMPARMGERIAVHQQNRRSAAAMDGDDAGAAGTDLAAGEVLEHDAAPFSPPAAPKWGDTGLPCRAGQ